MISCQLPVLTGFSSSVVLASQMLTPRNLSSCNRTVSTKKEKQQDCTIYHRMYFTGDVLTGRIPHTLKFLGNFISVITTD